MEKPKFTIVLESPILPYLAGSLTITPTYGSELATDGPLDNWDSPTNLTSWTETTAGTSSVNQESSDVDGGTYAARLDVDASNSNVQFWQQITAAVGNWLHVTWRMKGSDGTATGGLQADYANLNDWSSAPGTSYVTKIADGIITTANPQLFFKRGVAASKSLYFAHISAKLATASTCMDARDFYTANVRVNAGWTIVAESLAGIVSKLDSTTNPQNYTVLAHDGRNTLYLIKVVAGTPTVVTSSGSATYAAGALVELRWTADDTVDGYYNGSKEISAQTINDAGITGNTIHGRFSCYGGNSSQSFFAQAL